MLLCEINSNTKNSIENPDFNNILDYDKMIILLNSSTSRQVEKLGSFIYIAVYNHWKFGKQLFVFVVLMSLLCVISWEKFKDTKDVTRCRK